MQLENLVRNLTIHEMRLKEHKKRLYQDSKEDQVALKAKKGKAKMESSSNYDDEEDDAEVNLLIKGFNTFFKSKKGQNFLYSKRRQFNNRISRK